MSSSGKWAIGCHKFPGHACTSMGFSSCMFTGSKFNFTGTVSFLILFFLAAFNSLLKMLVIGRNYLFNVKVLVNKVSETSRGLN